MPGTRPTRILMVCMGNICRSPLAECVFRHKAMLRDVSGSFEVDSAGTGGWHAGEPPDPRVSSTASVHGIPMSGIARQVTHADFGHFDLLVCMDESNREHLIRMGAPEGKLRMLLEFDPAATMTQVPDPYYGGQEGFETVYRLVDAACDGLLDTLLMARK